MKEERALMRLLLSSHIYWLKRRIEENARLAEPCPEGRWRLAGPDPVPGAAEKADRYRAELVVAQRAHDALGLLAD